MRASASRARAWRTRPGLVWLEHGEEGFEERLGVAALTHAGTDEEGAVATLGKGAVDVVDDLGREEAFVVVEGLEGGLGELGGQDGVDRAGAGEGDDAGAGAVGAHAGEERGADVVVGARDDEGAAEGALVRVRRAFREQVAGPAVSHELRSRRRGPARDVGNADVDDFDAAGVPGAGENVKADLGPLEGDGVVGRDGARVSGAGVGVETGGKIDGQQSRRKAAGTGLVEAVEEVGEVAVDLAGAAGAEEGVDDEFGAAEGVVQALPGALFGHGDRGNVALGELLEVDVVLRAGLEEGRR